MGFYVELHCDTPSCPHGCSEEGPQGRNRFEVTTLARRAGWVKTAKGWRCAGCAAPQVAQ